MPTTCWLAPSSMKSITWMGCSSFSASAPSSAISSCARSASCSGPGNGRRAMRLVFCGTPQFAIPTLQQLLAAGHTIELVVTQPDRVVGRDKGPSPPPVKVLAEQAGLPVVQPEKIKNNPDFRARLEAIKPDAIIVVAYGRIIPEWMLNLPPLGNINLHASLLPKYRGAAPIQWAVANGESVTGATTMRLDQGLDTGNILLQRSLPIEPDQTAEQLFPVL